MSTTSPTAAATTTTLPVSPFSDMMHTIGLNVLAWALFVACDTINKYLAGHYSVLQLTATATTIGVFLTAAIIYKKFGTAGFYTTKWKYHVGRGICYVVSSYFGLNAIARIPLADFYGIVFLSPLMIALLAHFVLHEKIGPHRIAAILVGFCGVLVITGAHFGDFNIGYIYAVIGATATSASAILVRKIGKEKVTSIYAFYLFLVGALAFVPMAIPHLVMPRMEDIPLFVIFTPLALVALVTYAVSFSRATETALIAPFHYTQIIWGSLIGFFLFGEVPGPATIAGATIIIGAGLYLIWREHYRHVKHIPESPA